MRHTQFPTMTNEQSLTRPPARECGLVTAGPCQGHHGLWLVVRPPHHGEGQKNDYMYTRSIPNDDHTPFEGFTHGGTTHIIEDDDITVICSSAWGRLLSCSA